MFFGCALALVLTTALAEHSTTTITQKDAAELVADAETKKRPQSAFLHERDDLDKYQGMQESASRLRDADDRYLELVTNELEKRASMRGFQGMRGKKSDYEPSLSPAASYYYGGGPTAALLDYYNYKRAPMGFQGMRGKKSGGDLLADDELEKRAPMGFQGMRGKKSLEEVLEELEKRSMMGFQGMRGKKAEEFDEAVQQEPAEWQKRAPMGFQGMRGRKSSFIDELDELEKRAILGFHGMRGKKNVAYEREDLPMDIENYVEKRPMMMGFHGMRGKRSADYYGETSMRYEKRSPYRFFGTRGKKNPRWELRGKFVGVRGKKWTMPPDSQLLLRSLYDDLRLATESERH